MRLPRASASNWGNEGPRGAKPEHGLQVAQQRAVTQARRVQLAGFLQCGAGGDEFAVLVDRRRRPVRLEELGLESVELGAERPQRRSDAGRRPGELPAESRKVPLRLRGAQIEEAVLRRRAAAVVEAGVVEHTHLRKRGLADGAHGRRAHAFEGCGRNGSQIVPQHASHAGPLRLESSRLSICFRALCKVRGGGEVDPRGRQPLERQQAPAVLEGLLGAGEHGASALLDLGPHVVGRRVVPEIERPALDLRRKRIARLA